MQKSPYTPGDLATILPGRNLEIAHFKNTIDYVKISQTLESLPIFYVGSRGVGKTSLLRTFQQYSEENKFYTVWITGNQNNNLIDIFFQEFSNVEKKYKNKVSQGLKKALYNLSLTLNLGVATVGVEVKLAEQSDIIANKERALQETITEVVKTVLKNKKNGLVLFIDELQDIDKGSLKTLAIAWQHMQAESRDISLVLVGAGLRHTSDIFTDAASFAERFTYSEIGNLSEKDAKLALMTPASDKFVFWNEEALNKVVTKVEGYPYFIQLFGDYTWRSAVNTDEGAVLTLNDVQRGEKLYDKTLDEFFRTRWKKATNKEQHFLTTMALLGGQNVKRSDIAEKMSRSTQSLGDLRRALMDKGIISDPQHGLLSFTAPGFRVFIANEAGLAIKNN